jgi:hypothetical protein
MEQARCDICRPKQFEELIEEFESIVMAWLRRAHPPKQE